ncbi:alpha/beta hydrolase-fold protein [Cohnella rhizosphaerae]|uniref:Alpha/beta hydrolase-fold protein n=1 Tax=Cohnella rhizosphaerae TaxID=1457232 RepID=A0A9X4QRA5_9BACL|nr:alpha/beta hydrolase-fold protein [Cohnella rhizosphaerae]MDG0808841.1 alpha/beta hydrolase-fold protein [Cohnella rhizosphaerae]
MNTTYGFKYFDYLTQELPLVVKSLFAAADGREHTFTVGMAMGGNGALALGLMRPDLYAAAVDLSGGIGATLDREAYKDSLGWGFSRVRDTLAGADAFVRSEHDLLHYAERNIAEGVRTPAFFIATGDRDFIRDRVRADASVLRRLGYEVRYEEAPGMGHDYEMWDLYLQKALGEWLPLRRTPIYLEEDCSC